MVARFTAWFLAMALLAPLSAAGSHGAGEASKDAKKLAPDLPIAIFLSPCSGDRAMKGCYQQNIVKTLQACGYPNYVEVLDSKDVSAVKTALGDGRVPLGFDNYLAMTNSHGWVDEEQKKSFRIGDGKNVDWSGDDYVDALYESAPAKKAAKGRFNVWMETCQAGACSSAGAKATGGLGCACDAKQTAMLTKTGGVLGVIARVLCDAHAGTCGYHYNKDKSPRFDKNGDGRLDAAEMATLLKNELKGPVTAKRNCEAPLPPPGKADGISGTALTKAGKQLDACIEESKGWCTGRGGTTKSLPKRDFLFSVDLKFSGTYTYTEEGKKEKQTAKFENVYDIVPTIYGSQKEVEEAWVNAVQSPKQYLEDRKETVTAMLYPNQVPVGGAPKGGGAITAGNDGGYQVGAKGTPRTIHSFTIDKAEAVEAKLSTRQQVPCEFGDGTIATGGSGEGVQIPELRDFALDIPRCALRPAAGPAMGR